MGKYETGELASWNDGDWNGDQQFESGDIIEAFQAGGYEQGPQAPVLVAVPEPCSQVATMLLVSLIMLRRRAVA